MNKYTVLSTLGKLLSEYIQVEYLGLSLMLFLIQEVKRTIKAKELYRKCSRQ